MFILGITGGIGAGKSTLAGLLREAGLPVLDADAISREVSAPGGVAMPRIAETFGSAMLTAEGGLQRAAMAELVFRDKKALDSLSQLVHEAVFQVFDEELERLRASGQSAVVLDVPIPVQHGFVDRCDQIWGIWAEDAIRLQRLAKRGMPQQEARRRMAVQLDRESYEALCTHFLDNSGSQADLRRHCQALMEEELGARGIPFKDLCPEV